MKIFFPNKFFERNSNNFIYHHKVKKQRLQHRNIWRSNLIIFHKKKSYLSILCWRMIFFGGLNDDVMCGEHNAIKIFKKKCK